MINLKMYGGRFGAKDELMQDLVATEDMYSKPTKEVMMVVKVIEEEYRWWELGAM